MLGSYSVAARAVRFTPRFPLDPGREYEVTFDPSRLPSRRDMKLDRVVAVVSRPKEAAVPSTEIEHVYPTAEVWPQNQLRLYIHFSEPMGRRGGLDHVRVLGDDGREVEDLFLPLFDAQFWNIDRTRYTLFFDPGRVKRGLLPREQLGPGLQVGRRYTLVVDEDWRDAEGLPLRAPYRKDFLVGPPAERPLNPQQWQLTPPRADTHDPLILTFPDPLDHGLLLRVLGVSRRDEAIDGEVRIEASETRWIFTPRSPWRRGDHQVIALSILEDGAGNRIGRAFEMAHVAAETHTSEPTATTIPFRVAP